MEQPVSSDPAGPVAVVLDRLAQLWPGHQRHVRSFEEDARAYGPLNRRPLGLRNVPLDRIVGSVGRARELGADFQPPGRQWQRHRRERYDRVLNALKSDVVLPPVELYKLGYNYYVVDGNHRVAAMKELTGNDGDIDAYVTQFLPAGDTEAARVYLERRAFEEATGLTNIGAVELGSYPTLLKEIEHYRADLQAHSGAEVSPREAANDWFMTVWLPRAALVRRANLRRHWPEKRTADIYCYIQEHLAAESARLGRPVDWMTAFANFRRRSQAGPSHRPPVLRRLFNLAIPWRPGRSAVPSLPRPDDERDLERTGES